MQAAAAEGRGGGRGGGSASRAHPAPAQQLCMSWAAAPEGTAQQQAAQAGPHISGEAGGEEGASAGARGREGAAAAAAAPSRALRQSSHKVQSCSLQQQSQGAGGRGSQASSQGSAGARVASSRAGAWQLCDQRRGSLKAGSLCLSLLLFCTLQAHREQHRRSALLLGRGACRGEGGGGGGGGGAQSSGPHGHEGSARVQQRGLSLGHCCRERRLSR